MNTEELKSIIQNKLSEKRFTHTVSVLETALKYANLLKEKYSISDADIEKLEAAALLHDICKELSSEEMLTTAEFYGIKIYAEDEAHPNVLHARVAKAYVEEEFEIYDPLVLAAIEEHTLGSANMSTISKILYLADFIEPLRDKKEKEANTTSGNPDKETYCDSIRKILEEELDLDKALIAAMDSKLAEVVSKGNPIHPLSVEARNALVQN